MEPCVGQIVRWKVRLSSFMQEKSRMLEESLYKDLHKEGDKGASFMTWKAQMAGLKSIIGMWAVQLMSSFLLNDFSNSL